ncbi:hypothetical protein CBD41_05780 [bacterium TMED181]|nr:tyrosine recombinase [Planctomycetota bacterium]OUW44459.1 MAG: hypothetical protein CBD41_05780 [bacterium TMED181]
MSKKRPLKGSIGQIGQNHRFSISSRRTRARSVFSLILLVGERFGPPNTLQLPLVQDTGKRPDFMKRRPTPQAINRGEKESLPVSITYWLDHLRIERGLAENTLSAYRRDLVDLANYCQSLGLDFPKGIHRGHLQEYLKSLADAGNSAHSRQRKLVALRGFFKFHVRENRLTENPTDLILLPRKDQRLPHTLSVDQIESMIEAAGDPERSPKTPLRDRAVIELLYSTGMRVSELCGLRPRDLFLGEGFLRCFGKGSKERIIPVGDRAELALQKYQDHERAVVAAEEDRVFLSIRGLPLHRRSVYEILRKSALFAGIGQKVHPHMLRHSYATHLLANDAELFAIQELLGHSSVSSTEIYTHVERKKLLETHGKFHPRP